MASFKNSMGNWGTVPPAGKKFLFLLIYYLFYRTPMLFSSLLEENDDKEYSPSQIVQDYILTSRQRLILVFSPLLFAFLIWGFLLGVTGYTIQIGDQPLSMFHPERILPYLFLYYFSLVIATTVISVKVLSSLKSEYHTFINITSVFLISGIISLRSPLGALLISFVLFGIATVVTPFPNALPGLWIMVNLPLFVVPGLALGIVPSVLG